MTTQLTRMAGGTAALLAALLCAGWASVAGAAGGPDSDRARADALLRDAAAVLRPYLADPLWEGLLNSLGGARAVFIVPEDIKASALLGMTGGEGVLLRRHGAGWSDPVFMKLSSVSVGLQAGVETQKLLMIIMTDSGVDDLLAGAGKIGGSGGFALAKWGLGVSGSGGTKGGLQVLTVATGQGLSLGGGLQHTTMSFQKDLNAAYYGVGVELRSVAAARGRSSEAAELRTVLEKAVARAWGQ